jgi:hypothetical protein
MAALIISVACYIQDSVSSMALAQLVLGKLSCSPRISEVPIFLVVIRI